MLFDMEENEDAGDDSADEEGNGDDSADAEEFVDPMETQDLTRF